MSTDGLVPMMVYDVSGHGVITAETFAEMQADPRLERRDLGPTLFPIAMYSRATGKIVWRLAGPYVMWIPR